MFKSKRLITGVDGSKEYAVSALIVGSRAAASLISSSRDEKASETNHNLYALAIMMFVNMSPK
jgi:hypothetical protein